MITPSRCPRCGDEPEVCVLYGVTVACGNCWEPGTGQPVGAALTVERAVRDWNDQVAEYEFPEDVEDAFAMSAVDRAIWRNR